MKKFSILSIYFLSIFSLAWALPAGYNFVFSKDIAKTAVFYSPTDKIMVYTEQLRIDDENARAKSEDHHADVAYKDADGNYYNREEFEAKIPFIYFRNMEMRGLLPLEIDGQSYDRARIEQYRRVLEISAYQMPNKSHEYKIYSLLESNPNQVALVLPADRFRMSSNAMEFVDSDLNKIDTELTELFTSALLDKGFVFPAKNVWGNFTIFKPYDAGVFILDNNGQVFHILRKNNLPEIVKLPINVIPQKILITETQDKKFYGLIVDIEDKVYLLHVDNYALTHIPSPSYNPNTMDFKVLLDPIYLTAIYSDNKDVYANAYYYNSEDKIDVLEIENSFTMQMSRTQEPFYAKVANALFPFRIEISEEESLKAVLNIQFNRDYLNYGIFLSILLALIYRIYYKRNRFSISPNEVLGIAVFGIYLFLPFLCMEAYRKR